MNQSSRLSNLVSEFEKKYGHRPELVCRSPGRVNLIGEHVDYSGFPVLPMAIEQDTMIAISLSSEGLKAVESLNTENSKTEASLNTDGGSTTSNPSNPSNEGSDTCASDIRIANVEPDKWESFSTSSALDMNQKLPGSSWYNYVLCGIIAIKKERHFDYGFDIMVDGKVPIGSGLSSSSALVCCTAYAVSRIVKIEIQPSVLADIAAKSERFIGMESGGMDQAISIMAVKGAALFIEFDPISSSVVELDSSCDIVIVDSLVQSCKYATASSGYNLRVVECRFAALIVGKKMDLKGWKNMKRLRDLKNALNIDSFSEMSALMKKHLNDNDGVMSLDDVAKVLGMDVEECQKTFGNPTIPRDTKYKVRDRSVHVFEESARVQDFRKSQDPAKMGALMNESHESCRRLYECSCKELDDTVEMCRSLGAYGARLTGAGWGGWCVCLVPRNGVEDFKSKLWKWMNLNDGTSQDDHIIVTKAAQGASSMELPK